MQSYNDFQAFDNSKHKRVNETDKYGILIWFEKKISKDLVFNKPPRKKLS